MFILKIKFKTFINKYFCSTFIKFKNLVNCFFLNNYFNCKYFIVKNKILIIKIIFYLKKTLKVFCLSN